MSKIEILAESLANQIAAGEVVERPASVVKELVENSIDAGSTKIKVEIEEAGLQQIIITDNGRGIAYDQVEQAFERHATSKLYTADELFRIRTLGFRGEALPSIASVAHLTIETAQEGEKGKRLVLAGGEIVENTTSQARRGTILKVEQLFYNTPARLKHVRSLQTETSHISKFMNRFALSNPDISFEFYNDGNLVMKTVGNGDLQQAIAGVYGVNIAKKMRLIEAENFDFKVSGYTTLPEVTRANNSYITLIVNGRYIRNYHLNQAVISGYGTTLMVKRSPISVINIEMDPLLLDVNVHPTKQQVRISNETDLGQLIKEAIHTQMHQEVRIPSSSSGQKTKEIADQQAFTFRAPKDTPPSFEPPSEAPPETQYTPADLRENTLDKKFEVEEEKVPVKHIPADFSSLKLAEKRQAKPSEPVNESFPELEYIGQLHGTYLLTQNNEGLFVIDQHAAQERIKYEYYKEKLAHEDANMQDLLVPIVLEYPSDEVLILNDNLDKLASAGIILENFGGKSFIVRQHPTWMIAGQEQSTIEEMIDFFLEKENLSLGLFREATAIMMSCKRSIKANHYLNKEEAVALIEQLAEAENPYNCPHGRPVLVKITTTELEKMFKRIQDSH